jgi:hypothetical protein
MAVATGGPFDDGDVIGAESILATKGDVSVVWVGKVK